MLTLSDGESAGRLRALLSPGMTTSAYQRDESYLWDCDVNGLGFNYRMNDVQAAMGIEQLKPCGFRVGV